MSGSIDALRAWQTDTTERLRSSPEGSRWLIVSPTGTGKNRAVATAARAWRSRASARTLIVARQQVAENLAEQIEPGTPLRWLPKSMMREEGWDLAFDPPEVMLAATSGDILADPWVVDALSDIGWSQIIVDLDSGPSEIVEPVALLASRNPRARLVMLASPPVDAATDALDANVIRYGGTAGTVVSFLGLAQHYRSANFDRTNAELSLIADIDLAVAEAGVLARPLGLEAVQAAASSSFYAMQTTALTALKRLRERRNLLVHQALGAEELGSEGGPMADEALVRVFALFEKWAAAVDRLTFDSRHQAFLRLVLPPASVDRAGSTVVFCALAATAEYVDHGLRFMRQSSTTLSNLRQGGISPDSWLQAPGAVLVVFDAQLKGLEFGGARQAVNYDVPTAQHIAIRSTRLRWTDSSRDSAIWTLLPRNEQLSALEKQALAGAPFLVGAAPSSDSMT